jgi:hypothetical protein
VARALLMVLVPTLLAAAPAAPAPAGDDAVLLVAAARRLFAAKGSGGAYRVELLGRTDMLNEGFSYRTYQVIDGGTSVGRFTRVEVPGARGDRVDVAVRLDGEKVVAAVPVRPLKLGDALVDDLSGLTGPFRGIPADRWAGCMAGVFGAFAHLERVVQARAPATLERERAASVVNTMTVTQPAPVLGEPCPDFRRYTLDGQRVSRYTYQNRPFMVMLGSLRDSLSTEMTRNLAEFMEENRTKASLVMVLEDRPQHLMDHLKRGGSFPGTAVSDPEATSRPLFKAPHVPYLFLYDVEGKLVSFTPYPGMMKLRAILASYRARILDPWKPPTQGR